MFIQILFILIGFTLLIKGADFLVDGSNAIAKKLHISEIVIGLTIVIVVRYDKFLFLKIYAVSNVINIIILLIIFI